jgi:hypothetical protein
VQNLVQFRRRHTRLTLFYSRPSITGLTLWMLDDTSAAGIAVYRMCRALETPLLRGKRVFCHFGRSEPEK